MTLTQRQDWSSPQDQLCAPFPMHTWFQLPIRQSLSCCRSERTMHRQRKHLCCPDPKPAHLNCRGPFTPNQPRVVTLCCHQHQSPHDSQPSVCWCILPPAKMCPAVCQGCGVKAESSFFSTGCCHCPSLTRSLPCCLTTLACVELIPKLLEPIRAALLREGFGRTLLCVSRAL